MFNKKQWVTQNLKSGYDKGIWTAEHIMENAMKYSMAGVLDDADLEELAAYTEPNEAMANEQITVLESEGDQSGQTDTEIDESELLA